ncbi:TylF/MycF/NovP-related O-methyltransferase [Methylotuvimicrobium sp. KM2]|uniref:TylF/MycF/NovP-related O-methyltransferase n=1 Tax=Methylotuvimicrobium sp. KM2 TaxID=3133976 RepID=UPI0031019828
MNPLSTLLTTLRRHKAIKMMARVKEQKLTYLSVQKMQALIDRLVEIENKNLPGIIIEAGCALGGSAIVLASAKNCKRPMQIYDVFGMIPPPSERDGPDVHERYNIITKGQSKGIDGDEYYGYLPDLYDQVVRNFEKNNLKISKNNISIIKGLVQEKLIIASPICLAHIDVDWYDPVFNCLKRIEPYLVAGGSIILDDYHDWSGCREATDDFFQDKRHKFQFDTTAGSLTITKIL